MPDADTHELVRDVDTLPVVQSPLSGHQGCASVSGGSTGSLYENIVGGAADNAQRAFVSSMAYRVLWRELGGPKP